MSDARELISRTQSRSVLLAFAEESSRNKRAGGVLCLHALLALGLLLSPGMRASFTRIGSALQNPARDAPPKPDDEPVLRDRPFFLMEVQAKEIITKDVLIYNNLAMGICWMHESDEGFAVLGLAAADAKERIALLVYDNGLPALVFRNKQGERPVLLTIDRAGDPRLEVTAFD